MIPRIANPITGFSKTPLTDQQIMRFAPSIFAEEPHESRSDKYQYISTIEIIDHLRKLDYQPYMVCQSRVRDQGQANHTKHLMRFRHASHVYQVGEEFNEIYILNSHNGSSSYQIGAGIFRLVCLNGLVCGENYMDKRVRHMGNNILEQVVSSVERVHDKFKRINESREEMKSIRLNDREQLIFANAALETRFPEGTAPIQAHQLLRSRRSADDENTLWSVFNRAQENLIKGNLPGRNANNRATTTRAIKGIDANLKVNQLLWGIAEYFAEEKRKLKAEFEALAV